MRKKYTKQEVLIATVVLIAVVSLSYATYVYLVNRSLDKTLEQMFVSVASVDAYTQEVVTETTLSDRILKVEGLYFDNKKDSLYASYATTTFIIPDYPEPLTFSLNNIAVGNAVYVKVETESPVLKTTIPTSKEWKRFENTAIPEEYQNIAIPGAVLDNMAIFGKKGSYVTLIKRMGTDTTFGDNLLRYQFKLSGKTPNTQGPTTALIERIGSEGIIDAWIDKATAKLKYIVFTNLPYTSTTTISSINNPPLIPIPILP